MELEFFVEEGDLEMVLFFIYLELIILSFLDCNEDEEFLVIEKCVEFVLELI